MSCYARLHRPAPSKAGKEIPAPLPAFPPSSQLLKAYFKGGARKALEVVGRTRGAVFGLPPLVSEAQLQQPVVYKYRKAAQCLNG